MDVFKRYQGGETVRGAEWVEDIDNAWVVQEDIVSDRATGQFGLFDNDIFYTKLHPVVELTAGQEHLLRAPEPIKKVLPITFKSPEYQAVPEQQKLEVVRTELEEEIEKERQINELRKAIQADKTLKRKI